MIFGDEWWGVICEEESRCIICGERNKMGVECAFWVNLLKLVFFEFLKMNFVTLKIIKQNGIKFVIFVNRNVIEKRGIEIGMFGVMRLSFL